MGRPFRVIKTSFEEFNNSPGIPVLELFCCSGVCSETLHKLGAKVFGIDIVKPSSYHGTFMQSNVLNISPAFIQQFKFVFASPPCQLYSIGSIPAISKGKLYPDLVPFTRELLTSAQVPGIIENVPQARLRPDFMLCGSMFGLPVMRHRFFEAINWLPFFSPLQCDHSTLQKNSHTIAGSFKGSIHTAAESFNCSAGRLRSEIKEGYPPAYAEFIFKTFLNNSLDF